MKNSRLSTFVKYNRSRLKMSQAELAGKSGVGLRFIRELEQGKESLRLDKVNQVLLMFGHTIAPLTTRQVDPYDILLNYLHKDVRIRLEDRKVISGRLTGPVYRNGEISEWRFQAASYISEPEKNPTGKEMIILHSAIREINQGFI